MANNSLLLKKNLSEYGQVLAIELSPFVLSQDLILIGFEECIVLGHLKTDEEFDLEVLCKFKSDYRTSALSISPDTSITSLPNNILFASVGTDYKIRITKSDSIDDKTTILDEHSGYVNDVKFDTENIFLASVSDDCTAKLWETEEFTLSASFRLTSPGMSVCWHREDCFKLLVAEKSGLIRFYNVETQSPILSLDYGRPLNCAHWAPSDSQLLVSLQLGELLIWNLEKICSPEKNILIFTELGGNVKISPFGELIAAVNSLDGNLKVVNTQNQHLKLSAPVSIPSNVSWHCRLPIVCVGDYMNLCFWKV